MNTRNIAKIGVITSLLALGVISDIRLTTKNKVEKICDKKEEISHMVHLGHRLINNYKNGDCVRILYRAKNGLYFLAEEEYSEEKHGNSDLYIGIIEDIANGNKEKDEIRGIFVNKKEDEFPLDIYSKLVYANFLEMRI